MEYFWVELKAVYSAYMCGISALMVDGRSFSVLLLSDCLSVLCSFYKLGLNEWLSYFFLSPFEVHFLCF